MSLETIYQEIIDHPDNQWAKDLGYPPVYQVSKSSKILIVGQAPGSKAQASVTPWHDVSGDRLRAWLGVTEAQFYNTDLFALVPMDFYYPGKGKHGDLPPRKDFAPLWHPRILAEMKDLQLILLVGSYAQKYYLGEAAKANLTETVQAFHEYLPKFIPLVHPSPLNFRWLTRNPWFTEDVIPELQKTVAAILAK